MIIDSHLVLTWKQFDSAKAAYRRVLERDPNHAKVLQQLGWLHHQQSSNYASQEQAIEYLEKSVASGKLVGSFPPCYVYADKYIQTKLMHKAGTCLVVATCHSRSTPRPTRPISRQFTGMVATRPSGAPSVCSITRSTSIVMRLMPIPAPSVSTPTSAKCGTTLEPW